MIYILNQIILVGRLTRDITVNKSDKGSKVATLSLAIPRSFKNSEGIYDRKKYSYKFGKFRDDFYDKFDFKPCLFAKSKDDCDGLNALSNYYHNAELKTATLERNYDSKTESAQILGLSAYLVTPGFFEGISLTFKTI